ncbi:Thiol-disulfide oxidoreductase ResA [Caulifigura coniformis]|uniref:Thiol-disulfide oxidoreductase ResA n=1 Tax=Caulifigura coniformis TaxID=2527983 RepID=A0A517SBE4_9PLAN|nr:TlpA disulfide reductase family protein [Caulifigura coniformis]QDT53432.1 Thiol-disulfide oxidoreductase ResA [Caulifigura coniformis]
MSTTLYNAWGSLMAGCAVLSLLASLAFLIRALFDWRNPFRNQRLAWSGLLAAGPFITTAVHLGMLYWVHGAEDEEVRQNRVISGIAATLLPVLILVVAQRLSQRRHSGGKNLAPFALAAAVPFVLAGIQSALLFRVHLPGVAREAQLANQAKVDDASIIQAGAPAPAFHLPTVDGATFDLSSQRGNVVLINFFATWCAPCVVELPLIEGAWNDYRDRRDFSVLVIGRGEKPDAVAAFRLAKQLTFPMAADPQGEVFSLFAREGIPRTYLIGRDGTVRLALTGFSRKEFEQLRGAIADELESSP